MNYQGAKVYALTRLQEELPEHLYYHGVHHTLDVCSAAEALAASENIGNEDLLLLSTAAMFHDIGFITHYQGHEMAGCRIAATALPQFDYAQDQVEVISNLILATRMPQNPHTPMEAILCDADLDYLGRTDFFAIADTLRREWIALGMLGQEEDWHEKQIPFLAQHHYFTKTAREKRDPQKKKNLQKLKMLR